MISTQVRWNDAILKAKVRAAVRPAAAAWFAQAQARAPSPLRLLIAGTSAMVMTDGLGLLFEFGAGPHEIEPRDEALKLPDGGFVRGPVKHPGMEARPFLRPGLSFWPATYRRFASGML